MLTQRMKRGITIVGVTGIRRFLRRITDMFPRLRVIRRKVRLFGVIGIHAERSTDMVRSSQQGRGARALLRRGVDDLRHGRNLDMYATFLVSVGIAVLGIFDVVHIRFVLTAMLAALAFLVLHVQPLPTAPGLDDILRDRGSFTPFPVLLDKARDVRIYGPTAVHVILHAAEHRRLLLNRGGRLRIMIQGQDPAQLAWTAEQLDKSLDFAHSHAMSLGELRRLAGAPGFEYRLMPGNPGFSIVVVDPDTPHGYLIVETHGFGDAGVHDRMHVRITKAASPRWFAYWLGCYEAMWNTASPDTHPPASANGAVSPLTPPSAAGGGR